MHHAVGVLYHSRRHTSLEDELHALDKRGCEAHIRQRAIRAVLP